jgi:pimeloyl-ACP methyl ester carboxylesterase
MPRATGDSSRHTLGASHTVTLRDGRQIRLRRKGNGGPTVVFESGIGVGGAIWGLVAPVVSERATAVVYDRAGMGLSDEDDAPRTLDRVTDDLAEVLDTLDGPFVLVGTSWGGPIIRNLAMRREFDVRGLVLVDQTDENAPALLTPKTELQLAWTSQLTMALARTGLYRLTARIGRDLPPDVYADLRNDFTVRGARVVASENREVVPGLRRLLRQRRCRLDGIAVSVITGTRANRFERSIRRALNSAHRATASGLADARLVEAAHSGHYVMFSEPDVIVTEIARLVETVQGPPSAR